MFLCISIFELLKTIVYDNDKVVNMDVIKGDLVINKHVQLITFIKFHHY